MSDPSSELTSMTGAEWIAEFLARVGATHVFLLTGGACAFMVDAVARHPELSYLCFEHEQAASFAADAVWRASGKVGVTLATSGPGATNLITGIATSYFDSIPTLHITGQVNQREASAFHGAKVRQSGFQETDIVSMVAPITKYAIKVRSVEELRTELPKAYTIAISGRGGPVLIDVPMDVQQSEMTADFPDLVVPKRPVPETAALAAFSDSIRSAKRPVVLWGGGIGLAGVERDVAAWLERTNVPFVSSWAGLTYFNHNQAFYVGQIGVYGNRGANFVLQNADTVIVLGSRLDNRQRSGNPDNFAINARIIVFDVDIEELRKYIDPRYTKIHCDLKDLPAILPGLPAFSQSSEWTDYVAEMRTTYAGQEVSTSASRLNSLSPYDVIRRLADVVEPDAIIPNDTGAAVCWAHQAFKIKHHLFFTSGGNSPMGYALPAAIGAKVAAPERQVVCLNGDGGVQLNIQELQTIVEHQLDIAVVVMNNASYGIIKQFQDSYLNSRYDAAEKGYSAPDFRKVAEAYGLRYVRVEQISDIRPDLFGRGPIFIDVILSSQTLIEPKLEMGRPINDQFPYLSAKAYAAGNRFVSYPRPDHMSDHLEPTKSADDIESA